VNMTSRSIPVETSAVSFERILEADLGTGDVLVSKSSKDIYDGGYVWTVTFIGQSG
jgi:hypothetical protein